jgi:hypothetical protein
MSLHKIEPGDMKPCKHMEGLVSSKVDGKLTGVAKLYTDWHVSQCPRCQAGEQTLITLKSRLGDLNQEAEEPTGPGLADEKWSSVEAQWQKEDASHN